MASREKIKILLIGDSSSVFIRELSSRLRLHENNFSIDVLSFSDCKDAGYFDSRNIGIKVIAMKLSFLEKIVFFIKLKSFLAEKNYDIINIHFVSPFLGYFSRYLKGNVKNKLIITFWGSDFYRVRGIKRWLQARLLHAADIITATNQETLCEIKKVFGSRRGQLWDVLRFGLAPLDEISKNKKYPKSYHREKLNLPATGRMVVCGYNGHEAQNHLGMINSIVTERANIPEDVFFVFPIAYGGNVEYRALIDHTLSRANIRCFVLNSFLGLVDISHLRLATDIMIQVQLTDQFSGSMQEHLFAGNMVITGDWLPYKALEDQGIELVKVASVSEVGETLLSCLNELEEWSAKNVESIWTLSSWDSNIQKWVDIYLS